jgi:CRP/FNR family nitrogen fixation transcriptional regulator
MALAFSLDDRRGARPAALLAQTIAHHGARTRFERNSELYAQDDDVERLFLIARGVVRTTRLGADGRRQVAGFYKAGDVLGLETGVQRLFGAEALTEVVAHVARRGSVRAFAGDTDLDRAILDATAIELERAQNHMMLLGLKNAREKVIAFLRDLAEAAGGQEFELAMSRQDMADYLGLTIETVSRTLGQLQDAAIVEFCSTRRFRLPERTACQSLAA